MTVVHNKKFMVVVMTVMALLVMPSVFATSLWVDDSTGLIYLQITKLEKSVIT